MSHKYLNDIGIKSTECCIFNTNENNENKKRQKEFKKQRKKFGFDERETWALDYSFATWLYSHLMWFKEYAGNTIDLTTHTFDIPKWNDKKNKICKKKIIGVNQLEAIDIMIDCLKYYITHYDKIEDYQITFEKIKYVCIIFGIVMPAMWW